MCLSFFEIRRISNNGRKKLKIYAKKLSFCAFVDHAIVLTFENIGGY